MKSTLSIIVFCFLSLLSKAAFEPVVITGYNADIVANGVGAATTSTTANADGGSPGFAFVTQDFQAVAGNAAPTRFLPLNGTINSVATSGNIFQLADYSSNNALRLAGTASGTLTFGTPKYASDVYLLLASGSGASTATITITFSDASTQVFTGQSVLDWYNGAGFAIQGIGRVALSNNNLEGDASNPRLYEMRLQINSANYSKQITSVTVAKTNTTGGATIFVMGVSVNTLLPCAAPTAQATSLVLTPTLYNIAGSFTAAAPAADKYLVLRTPGTASPTVTPVNGTLYTAGNTLGNAIVISASASTTFNDVGVTGNTQYTYTVYSYSDVLCYNAAYNTTSPLTANTTTPACAPITAGTYSVGPTGTYGTITQAINALYTAGGATGNVILELQATYTSNAETFPITIPNVSTTPCAAGTPTITVRPATGAVGLLINTDNTTAVIDFNGSKYFTFDGRPGGLGTTKQLSIVNTSLTGTTIRFINEASYNKVTYCDVQGQNTSVTSSALSGIIYFGGTTGANGNDFNTISYCDVHSGSAGFAAIGIVAYGNTTTTATYNDSNTVANCNVYDYFIANNSSTGIKVDVGNTAWTISGNSLYQTNPRTYTSTATQRALWITPNVGSVANAANNFNISGNYIGGNFPQAVGSPYGINGSANFTFMGMDLSLGGGTPSTVQSNTITNIALSNTGTSTTAGVFSGISTANGVIDITNNTIGSVTANSAISVINGSSGTSFGIRLGGGNIINVDNNKIGGIDVSGTGGAVSVNFVGIGTSTSGGPTTTNITNNLVGSLTAPNSINMMNPSTSTTGQSVTGINISVTVTASTISGNTVANLNNNHNAAGTASFTRGIFVATSASSITNNVVRDLSSSSLQTSGGASGAVVGIAMTSTNTAGCNVSRNKIYGLSLTASSTTAATKMTGLFYSGTSSIVSDISRNFIHSFNVVAANPNAAATGIDFATATANIVNNMIRLGIRPDGTSNTNAMLFRGISSNSSSATNNVWFNTIYIGGSNVDGNATNTFAFTRTSTSGTYSFQNNIFVNARSNAAAGGKHYALYFTGGTTGATVNYNNYYAPGVDNYIGYTGTADVQAYSSAWIAGDLNSISADPQFIAPAADTSMVNLHIKTTVPTPIEGAGITIATVTDDYDGDTRASLTPTDIGADAGNFMALDISAPLIVYTPFDYTCSTSDRTFSATISDASGVPVTGALRPRVYFQKNGGTWYSAPGTLSSGTSRNGTWSFTITSATMGGTPAGSQISYYVIAQDSVSTPNVGANPAVGLIATNVNTIAVPPTTPNMYNITTGPTPGTIVVTPSAASVCYTSAPAVKLKASGGTIEGILVSGTQANQNTASTTNAGYPAPFTNYYGGNRHQFLVLASELTAAGFAAGIPITSINFPVASIGSTYTGSQNFKIKIGHTTNTTMTAFTAGLNTVFGPITYTPTVGNNNQIVFTTPFVWNGTDNIIIETTFSNANTGGASDLVAMYNSPTAFQSTIVYRVDGTAAATVENATTVTFSYSARPDFTLTGLLSAPFTWAPTTGLYTNAAATTPYTGGQADSVWALPTATTTYTVKATTANSCSTTQTVVVTDTCGVMPVKLVYFKGTRIAVGNKLEWLTASEINNAGFELEKSADGRSFTKIGFITSKAPDGNSSTPLQYSFVDANAKFTNSYYRLKQLDKDGKFEYSNIVLLQGEKVNTLELTGIYPNPATRDLNVLIASPKVSEVTILITDITGKIILQKVEKVAAGSNNLNLSVEALNAGQYFLKVVCADGCQAKVEKFVKF